NLLELEQVVLLSADLLSQLTNYTALILGPNELDAKLKEIQLITLTDQTPVAILITDTGHVELKSLSISSNMSLCVVEKMVNILNDRLKAVPITYRGKKLRTEVYTLMKEHVKNHEIMYDYLKSVLQYEETAKLYIGGSSNIMMQTEFKD